MTETAQESPAPTLAAYRGRWAVVTGAASGIGLALADAFLDQGLNVVILDLREDAGQAAAKALARPGVEVRAISADVSDEASVLAAAQSLADQEIIPSVLWLNAGVGVGQGILDAPSSTVQWVMAVNVMGPIWTARAFVPLLRRANGPRHVGVTCSSASLTFPREPIILYGMSKQGAAAVAEALWAELADEQIGVTLLCPGLVNTDIWNAAQARPERFGGPRTGPIEDGANWRAAPSPAIVVRAAIQCMGSGGGYCAPGPDPDTKEQFERRVEVLRSGFDYLL